MLFVDLFRNAFGEANLALPRGVAKDRFHFEFEMLSAMDDSDSDDEAPSLCPSLHYFSLLFVFSASRISNSCLET